MPSYSERKRIKGLLIEEPTKLEPLATAMCYNFDWTTLPVNEKVPYHLGKWMYYSHLELLVIYAPVLELEEQIMSVLAFHIPTYVLYPTQTARFSPTLGLMYHRLESKGAHLVLRKSLLIKNLREKIESHFSGPINNLQNYYGNE